MDYSLPGKPRKGNNPRKRQRKRLNGNAMPGSRTPAGPVTLAAALMAFVHAYGAPQTRNTPISPQEAAQKAPAIAQTFQETTDTVEQQARRQ